MSPMLTPEIEAAQAARTQVLEEQAAAKAEAYYVHFTSGLGPQIWEDLQERAFVNVSTLDKGESGAVDPYATVANEGARTLALYIRGQIALGKRGRVSRETATHVESRVLEP